MENAHGVIQTQLLAACSLLHTKALVPLLHLFFEIYGDGLLPSPAEKATMTWQLYFSSSSSSIGSHMAI